MSDTSVLPDVETAHEEEVQQPRMWSVVLLDDDEHSYDYVTRMMRKLFGRSEQAAYQIAQRVDGQGRAICWTGMREHAEFKQEQVHGFGADPIMIESKGSMSAILEPADFSDDDDDGDA